MDTEHSQKPAQVIRRRPTWRKALDIYNAHELSVMREEVRRLEAELEEAHTQQQFWKRLKKSARTPRMFGI